MDHLTIVSDFNRPNGFIASAGQDKATPEGGDLT
jgi:hypothetical protein